MCAHAPRVQQQAARPPRPEIAIRTRIRPAQDARTIPESGARTSRALLRGMPDGSARRGPTACQIGKRVAGRSGRFRQNRQQFIGLELSAEICDIRLPRETTLMGETSEHPREFPRFEVNAYVDYTGNEVLLFHRIQNISLGGVCIQTTGVEEVGTLVDLVLNFPSSTPRSRSPARSCGRTASRRWTWASATSTSTKSARTPCASTSTWSASSARRPRFCRLQIEQAVAGREVLLRRSPGGPGSAGSSCRARRPRRASGGRR